ncbi:uncharacterized protein A4U43_C01F24340 [Asparagus officinalis]|uniref:EF-hand domain-containing protein n=1 Tax=Asparagus officinalis TaxID=4686 RepID=A0A5P1FUB3_ASPOF|nr:uncharacterized protein LOC109828767 [Asparagus officinalis]XP_020251279.1 uncharacterized protein LOC109828767 [Asparagus officinalis]XP_020251280.1 uncharacterized protein LOC109828767 [Asparagus officinalis]ONK81017.1 uncharacterized protein A4U43_C01F24340 [Asparagus officinalis]
MTKSENDHVQQWHGRQRQRQRATHAEKLRSQALKADDQEAYMKMVEESKNERLTMLLGKTNELLVRLGAAVQRQKDAEHTNDLETLKSHFEGEHFLREGHLRGECFLGELHCDSSPLFMLFDTNSDGLISFLEYIFFVTLLNILESSFSVAFKIFQHYDDTFLTFLNIPDNIYLIDIS